MILVKMLMGRTIKVWLMESMINKVAIVLMRLISEDKPMMSTIEEVQPNNNERIQMELLLQIRGIEELKAQLEWIVKPLVNLKSLLGNLMEIKNFL